MRTPFKDFNAPLKRNPVPINQTLMRSSFTLLLDSSNHLIKTISNMPEETNLSNPEQLVEQVLSSDKDTGIISFNDLKEFINNSTIGNRKKHANTIQHNWISILDSVFFLRITVSDFMSCHQIAHIS